jgi:hypothetical protein
LRNINRNTALHRKGWKLTHLKVTPGKWSSKVIGHLLGTVNRIKESCWEMPKRYWIASGTFLRILERR